MSEIMQEMFEVSIMGVNYELPVEFEYDYQPYEASVINPVDMAYEGSSEYVDMIAVRLHGLEDDDSPMDITDSFGEDELDDMASEILEIIRGGDNYED